MAETDKDDLVTLLQEDEQVEDIPEKLPLLPVRDVVIFPDMCCPSISAGKNPFKR